MLRFPPEDFKKLTFKRFKQKTDISYVKMVINIQLTVRNLRSKEIM